MATTTTDNASNGRARTGRVELREIPLSRIVVPDGFNPRGGVAHDAELEGMAETMRQRGCLQPVRVRASGTGEYILIAGERRYRAAVIAALTQLPAVVLPAGVGDEGERLDQLTDAMIENEVRCDLDPLQRALGFQAMIDCGLNVRGVAERMGGKAKRGSRERRIREHLAILSLPEDVRKLVAAGEVPMLAVKALAEIAAIHEELPAYAVAAVLDTDAECGEPYTWAEVVQSPLQIALSQCESLPAGLFLSSGSYPLDTFELGEKARKDLAAYEKLIGQEIVAVRFSLHVEQARLLGAAYRAGYDTLIVGQDVATRLAEDYIAGVLKETRAQVRRQREVAKQDQDTGGSDTNATDSDIGESQGSGEAGFAGQDPGGQREAERKKREKAIRCNLDLGVLAFKYLSRIKVDERVLRIFASVDLAGSLREIASRGARLSLPGWVTQTQQKNGKTKTTYMDTYEAETRAASFLEGAESASDIAGRTLTLIALASLANEEDAVPKSRRSYHTLTFRGPWAVQAERDLNAIICERIKEGQLPVLDTILGKRIAKDEQAVARGQEIASASARLESASGRIEELGEKELDQALSDAELAWGKYSPQTRELHTQIDTVRRQLTTGKAGEQEHSQKKVVAA